MGTGSRAIRVLTVFGMVLAGLAAFGPSAHAAGTADLSVTNSASVSSARVGDIVTYTIVATNNGPDASTVDVGEDLSSNFQILGVTCDRGVSSDGPTCEYQTVASGDAVTTRVVTKIRTGQARVANDTACVTSEATTVDPNSSNDCASASVRITGKIR